MKGVSKVVARGWGAWTGDKMCKEKDGRNEGMGRQRVIHSQGSRQSWVCGSMRLETDLLKRLYPKSRYYWGYFHCWSRLAFARIWKTTRLLFNTSVWNKGPPSPW